MILVTGGLGFIGSHTVLTLLSQGQDVIIVDNLSNANMQVLERLEYIAQMYIPFVKVDVRNTPALNKVFEQYSIDTVIHTAGFKSLDESVLKPLEYYNDNVSCIMSLLRAMQRTGVRQLVHLSSLSVYGISSLDLQEDTPFHYFYPNPYIKSQQMIEEIIKDTARTDSEWKIAMLRLGNIAGGFEHAVLGEFVLPLPKNIIPLVFQVAAQFRNAVDLRCTAKTADRTNERDFLHVLDATQAILSSVRWLSEQTEHQCESFNISGHATSMKELIYLIEEVTERKVPIEIAEPALYPELDQVGSACEKAKNILAWQPQHSLKKTIEDGWRFYRNLQR